MADDVVQLLEQAENLLQASDAKAHSNVLAARIVCSKQLHGAVLVPVSRQIVYQRNDGRQAALHTTSTGSP